MSDFYRSEPVDLAQYLPAFLSHSPIFKATNDANDQEHDTIRIDMQDVFHQFYVETATWGLETWEELVGIETDESRSLSDRRASVLAKLHKPPSVTVAFLTNMINLFTEVASTKVVESPEAYTVDIYLPDTGSKDFTKIDEAVKTWLPAHLGHTYHFSSSTTARRYMGAIVRLASRAIDAGRLSGDTIQETAMLWDVDTPIFTADTDAVYITTWGMQLNTVFTASTTAVRFAADAPIGATDGIFYIASDDTVRMKEG